MALPLYYNWRNLSRRRLSTVLTFIVVSVVVLVLAVLLSFAVGIQASLASTGSPRNIIVLKPGATAESTSILLPDEAARVQQAPNVAQGPSGEPLVSRELCVQTSIPRRQSKDLANVAVRGVDNVAFDIHTEVRLLEGRRFEQGSLEIMVGSAARDRYENLSLGEKIVLGRMGNREFTVVGVFEAGAGALESEIWVPRTMLADAYDRRFSSSIVLRLDDPANAEETIQYLEGSAVRLAAKSEPTYYEDLSKTTAEIVVLTTILIGIMMVGAIFAVANTMYAAVDGRRREIAMLRAIGFSRASILASFIVEAVLICFLACAAGLGVSLLVAGSRHDYLSDMTFTVLAYELRITPKILAAALLASVAVGVGGALAPAVKASRTRIIEALRKA